MGGGGSVVSHEETSIRNMVDMANLMHTLMFFDEMYI